LSFIIIERLSFKVYEHKTALSPKTDSNPCATMFMFTSFSSINHF
jgi:hypothetical protein